jgi:hypothetical protein
MAEARVVAEAEVRIGRKVDDPLVGLLDIVHNAASRWAEVDAILGRAEVLAVEELSV